MVNGEEFRRATASLRQSWHCKHIVYRVKHPTVEESDRNNIKHMVEKFTKSTQCALLQTDPVAEKSLLEIPQTCVVDDDIFSELGHHSTTSSASSKQSSYNDVIGAAVTKSKIRSPCKAKAFNGAKDSKAIRWLQTMFSDSPSPGTDSSTCDLLVPSSATPMTSSGASATEITSAKVPLRRPSQQSLEKSSPRPRDVRRNKEKRKRNVLDEDVPCSHWRMKIENFFSRKIYLKFDTAVEKVLCC